jgi:hypothetical protein
MRAHNDLDLIPFFKKGFECIDMGTGGITNDHAGSQMNNLRAVLHHFFTRIFDVATRTTVARCKTDQLHFRVRVYAESPFLVPHRSETLPARTATVAITDDYSNLGL